MTNTFTLPSFDGNQGLGYSYIYKGKKCCKVSLTADTNGIILIVWFSAKINLRTNELIISSNCLIFYWD
jgi:hypothetical protein